MTEPLDLFKKHLTVSEISELKTIRKDIEPLLNEPILSHFTDHSVSHSDRMVIILKNILDENLSKENGKKLSNDELFILLLSTYLHDIGMQIPKAFGIKTDICNFGNKEYSFIRGNHGEVSAEILDNIIKKDKDDYKIMININKKAIKPYIPSVCKICSRHQSHKKYNSQEKIALSGEDIRIGVLTGLLRIADQLDCDCRRVDMNKLDQYSISLESKMHWIACHYIDSLEVKKGNMRIIASFPESLSSSIINYISGRLTNKINSELEICIDELWENDIKLRFGGKVLRQKWDLSSSKVPLPDKVQSLIQGQIVLEKPQHIESKEEYDIQKTDWMSYWKMIGNPFLDQPLSYGSEYFIETKKFNEITGEINSLLNANQGDIKLLLGERGLGKTTLFEILSGQLKDRVYVKIIDVADVVTNVNNATDLYIRMFTNIDHEVFKYEDEQFSKDKFISKLNLGNLRIICIDSLDRLPSDKDQIIRDFFRQSQHLLTSMKKNTILILSCADRWKNFLNSTELSYLGGKNQWALERFQSNEARSMLDKRLVSAGCSFSDIFEEDCIVPLQAMSGGNPRQILINAENVCRLAVDEKKDKIDAKFFREKYKNFFEQAYTELLEEQSRRVPEFKEGLISLYCYYCEMERRNLDTNIGFDFLAQMVTKDIKQNMTKIQYYGPLRFVAKITSKSENGAYANYYTLHENIRKLFEILKKKGYSAKGFLSFYSISPEKFVLSEDREDVINKFKNYLVSTDDVGYYEQAKLDYVEITRNVKIGHIFIRKSWDLLEKTIVAILVRMDKLDAQKYESDKDKVFRYDDLGRKLYIRGAGQIMADQSQELINLFKSTINEIHIFMTHYPSAQWIRIERNNIVKGRSASYSKYGDKSIEICRNHLDLSFRELLEIYDRIRSTKKFQKILV